MAHLLVTSKTLQKHGQQMNDAAGSKPSAYAMKLMEKMGWKEGQGLGKNEDGMAKHIVITKREENMGLGLDNSKAADSVQEQWWHNSFSKTLATFACNIQASDSDSDNSSSEKKKSKKKKNKKDKKSKKNKSEIVTNEKESQSKKRKREQSSVDDEEKMENINYDALFKATGGARLGMRARREQKGKILRTEGSEALVVNK